MAEREIREILRNLCERLDRSVLRPVVKAAVPVAMGAGIAMLPGCDVAKAMYGAPFPEDAQTDVVEADASGDAGLQPAYMGPDAWVEDAFVPPDAAYMAPDVAGDAGLQPAYMGPD